MRTTTTERLKGLVDRGSKQLKVNNNGSLRKKTTDVDKEDVSVITSISSELERKEFLMQDKNKNCTNIINRKSYQELHEQIEQQEVPNHSCPLCKRNCVTKIDLLSHIEVHLDLKGLICLCCGKHTNNKKNLKRHFLKSHGEKKKETCHICQQDYLSLWSHNKAYHDPLYMSSEPIQCDFCPKTFMNTFLLSRHVAKHPIHEIFTCADCNSTFRSKIRLKEHIFRWHLPPQIACTQCPEMFYFKASLNDHLWTEHAINKKKIYVCDICGKILSSLEGYKGHVAGHSDEKPFMCTECGKKFRTPTNLYQHARIHSDLRPFSCDLCDKSFRIRNHLKQHMAVHNMVSTSTSRKRKRGNTRNEGDGTSTTEYEF